MHIPLTGFPRKFRVKQPYDLLWEAARKYLKTRQNDKHTLMSYMFAIKLLETHPAADPDIVVPAILLHDIGWSTVPEQKQLQSFGPNTKYPELQRKHEEEGAWLAANLLHDMGITPGLIASITEIIDGHDTRKKPVSLEDKLVREADMLWRYTPFGLETVSGWFGYTPKRQLKVLNTWLGQRFYSEAGREMAEEMLNLLRAAA
jgi:hypothetical protein